MKTILSLLCLLTFLSPAWAHQYDESVIVVDELVRVYDGDTITVDINSWPSIIGKEIGVRVRGVDTPEIRGKCGYERSRARAARDFVRQHLSQARYIHLVNIERGKYFRLIADVYYDGKNLAHVLIQNGHGRPYAGGSRSGWCD